MIHAVYRLAACLLLTLLCLPETGNAAPRVEQSLNGTWQLQKVDELTTPPAEGPWRGCDVPGCLSGFRYERAWLRRSFEVPAEMRDKRIKLKFDGVKFNSRVFVNGRHVGGCFGGYRPFKVDVTDVVRFDGPNELAVGVHDWTGVFNDGEKIDCGKRDYNWNRLRGIPRKRILSPIGGRYSSYGIWADVALVAHPAVYVKDLFIKPSVRQGQLVVDYTLANESNQDADVQLTAAVEETGTGGDQPVAHRDVLALPETKVHVPAGKTATVTVRQPWAKPHLWSHVDPHLYFLRTALSTGDVQRERFGFREFWIEGHKFYLNDTPVNLLATSGWPPNAPMTREEIAERWQAMKRSGCVAFRTHTQPWRRVHYEVADELGLLMIVEGAVWNDDRSYALDNPVFWDNYAGHLKAMVDRDKNRPSVVMWSLENELCGWHLNDDTPAKADLVRMGKLVKQWDPTRPITYESDGDPGGIADVIGIHYPHEYPDYTCWPNEIFWLEKPSAIHHAFFRDGIVDPQGNFFWRRDKPLYIGEFLWLPSRDPSWHTVFFGDEAYRDYQEYRNRGKSESWKMQIIGYRHDEVAGISPWTMVEGGPLDETNHLYAAHQYAYQPLAAYCLNYDSRFYAGEKVTRRLEVFNDAFADVDLSLAWTLADGSEVIDRGHQDVALKSTEHQEFDVVLAMPQVDRRKPLHWTVSLTRDGKQVFEDRHDYTVCPRVAIPRLSARLAIFDPVGKTAPLLDNLDIDAAKLASLANIPTDVDVLLIGSGVFSERGDVARKIGYVNPLRAAMVDFARRGGRVLVLRQECYPQGVFDTNLTENRSTMTFAVRADHPVLNDITTDDLKFWRGDHLVSDREPARPIRGASVPIIVAGSKAGLDCTPLLERPNGAGCIVHCQLKLIEKFHAEPTAANLLKNLLVYLSDYRSTSPGKFASPDKTALFGGDEAYRARLHTLGVRFDALADDTTPDVTSRYSTWICRGQFPAVPRVKQFLQQGGRVLVHRASRRQVAELNAALGIDLAATPYHGPVDRIDDDTSLPLPVLREDLYWLGKHRGASHSATPRADEVADGMFTKTLDDKPVIEYEVNDWKLSGQIVYRQAPGIAFATNGTISHEIDFAEDGQYVIGIRARGTAVANVYPVAKIQVDGRPFGMVTLNGPQWQVVTTIGQISKGRHTIAVRFVNDKSNPPHEDRNLYVDRVYVAPDTNPRNVRFLTQPHTTAVVPYGRGLLVFDQLRWDTETGSNKRAVRYALTLLTGLDADLPARDEVTIECETMRPAPGLNNFNRLATCASLGSNGYLSETIEVVKSGKYTLELIAAGSQAENVFPRVDVQLDGKTLGTVELRGEDWQSYLLDVDLNAGTHELSLIFTNDFYIPGLADRNLRLDQVRFYRK